MVKKRVKLVKSTKKKISTAKHIKGNSLEKYIKATSEEGIHKIEESSDNVDQAAGDDIDGFFEEFLSKESIFEDKQILQVNYTPETIPHREKQIKEIASILAPALKNEKPSNIFLYGKTGTGKTLSVLHVVKKLKNIAKTKKVNLGVFYLNCKLKRVADTEYRLVAALAREFGEDVPFTGLPTDEIYRIFVKSIDSEKRNLIIVLDEIDQLVKKIGDEILYTLTRMNSELKKTRITIVGISNDLQFANYLDPRVKSSLTEEDINFPSYNAIQLQDILSQRADGAFKDGVVKEGVIGKCAAYAAREHGDARRALDLLRVAGELADRENGESLEIKYIDRAEEKIERDLIYDAIQTLPKQSQITLLSIFELHRKETDKILTGDVYESYKSLCNSCGLKTLTQRRLSDLIAELDLLGIINARVISKGRYGRTREIKLAVPAANVPKLSKELKTWLGI
jgi:archaeal cell division control protein 6